MDVEADGGTETLREEKRPGGEKRARRWLERRPPRTRERMLSHNRAGRQAVAHLSLHCTSVLPGTREAIRRQFGRPYIPTANLSRSSSSLVHGSKVTGLMTVCHLRGERGGEGRS